MSQSFVLAALSFEANRFLSAARRFRPLLLLHPALFPHRSRHACGALRRGGSEGIQRISTMDVMTPLKITVCCQLLNICLDPLFIFGWGPIGALGVAGATPAHCLR
jgi:hypothetical protein